MIALKVTNAFADWRVGDTITDGAEMQAALATNPASVVRVSLGDGEEAAAKAANAPAAKADAPKAGDKAA